jgi:nicotinamide-nucleotide amidase
LPTAQILSQGDEVVTGQVADTNAAWLAEQLTDLGFTVVRHVSVGDRLTDLVDQIRQASSGCDLVLCTGGLGPTDDDLTAQAVAEAFDRPLVFDEVAMHHIEALYARFRRPMPEVNRKQAWLPGGCLRLDNNWGTAPGFAVDEASLMAFMPGVPREMRKMFQVRILPLIEERFSVEPGRLITLRCTGVGESNLQERVGAVDVPGVVVSYRTKLPENHVKLRFPPSATTDQVRQVTATVADRIGSPLFGIDGMGGPEGSLVEVVSRGLAEQRATVATAESCTGGRVAAMFTSVAGSSAWFLEGAVTYSNAAKVRMLGVQSSTLDSHGAVSEPIARQMAEGVRARSGATYGLSTTGIAGPGGGSEAKPVGTVHIALAGPNGTQHRHLRLAGNRDRIQSLATASVVDLLRRTLIPTSSNISQGAHS